MTRATRQRAFTLLEIILAVTLSIGLMGAVFLFYDGTLSARDAVNEAAEFAAAERLVMDRITDELRSAMVYPFLGRGMGGGTESVSFFAAALPGPAAWVVRSSMDDPIPPEQDLQWVGYRLRYALDEDGEILLDDDGNPIVLGLERTEQKIILSKVAEEGDQIRLSLLSPHVKFLRVRFLAQVQLELGEQPWEDSWSEDGLPVAVEISLGRKPLPGGVEPEEYPYEIFRRVIFIPGSVAAFGGDEAAGRAAE